jgi:hypothetical protein
MAHGRSTCTPRAWNRKLAHFRMSTPPMWNKSALYAYGELRKRWLACKRSQALPSASRAPSHQRPQCAVHSPNSVPTESTASSCDYRYLGSEVTVDFEGIVHSLRVIVPRCIPRYLRLLLQPGCPQPHAMVSVPFAPSQAALQYFSFSPTVQLQFGCAHVLASAMTRLFPVDYDSLKGEMPVGRLERRNQQLASNSFRSES